MKLSIPGRQKNIITGVESIIIVGTTSAASMLANKFCPLKSLKSTVTSYKVSHVLLDLKTLFHLFFTWDIESFEKLGFDGFRQTTVLERSQTFIWNKRLEPMNKYKNVDVLIEWTEQNEWERSHDRCKRMSNDGVVNCHYDSICRRLWSKIFEDVVTTHQCVPSATIQLLIWENELQVSV